jgi:uncharacterized protein YrrD
MASKLKKARKREIVTVKEGRRLSKPADILIDPEQHEVSVVVVTLGAVPDTSLVVDASAVQSFDTDTLAIDSIDSLKIAARDDEALRLLKLGLDFQGHRVLSSEGQRLGKIVQIIVDERGRVVQYRVRRGLSGWLKPSLKIDPSELQTSGGEMAVMRSEAPPAPQGPPAPQEPPAPQGPTASV